MFHRCSAGTSAITLSLLLWLLAVSNHGHSEDRVPVVAGFERFARHAFPEFATNDPQLPLADSVSDSKRAELESAGRVLLSELSCTACHASQLKELEPKTGPDLRSAGLRLQAAWIAAYLDQPQRVKPGSTMPDVLASIPAANKPRAVAALTNYLTSQLSPFPTLKASGANPVPHEFWNKGNAASGKQMFHTIGCVACHEPASDVQSGVRSSSSIDQLLETLEPEEIEKMGLSHKLHAAPSVPLPTLQDKYTRQGLAMFLFDPVAVRPAGRMPGFKLRTADAADIAAYLMTRDADPAAAVAKLRPDGGLREEGKRLFNELRCTSCHATKDDARFPPSTPLVRLNLQATDGCMAKQTRSGLPHYSIDNLQRTAITTAMAAEKGGVSRSSPTNVKTNDAKAKSPNAKLKESGAALSATESVQLVMQQLNCYACHERDKAGGLARGRDGYFETVGQVDLGDEGRLPPPLTGVGAKLTSAWLKTVLQGNGDVRPHLQIRMPKFPLNEVEPLFTALPAADAQFLAAHAGASATVIKKPEPSDKSLAEAGRAIFNLGCVQCHPIRGEALPSVVGVDVGRIGRRIDRQWFDQFLLNPASLKPRTRMPTFFAPGAVNADILGGDVSKQIAAVWSYLEEIDRQPLPEKIEQARRQNFELVPDQRPIVLRTFMQLAGTHAIAVGFPQHVHYAFDAESVRLAELWSGRFLDAQGTWNDRFAPEAMPLAQQRLPLPKGPDLALLQGKDPKWPDEPLNSPGPLSISVPRFHGYRLNKEGVPEFLYSLGEFAIVDRMAPLTLNTSSDKKVGNENVVGFKREWIITQSSTTASTSKPVVPPGSQLWLRVAASGKKLQRSANGLTYASGLTVTAPAQLMNAALLRNVGEGSQCIVPLAKPGSVTIEYRWNSATTAR